MLTLRHKAAEPVCIAKARAALSAAASHPDAIKIGEALDTLSHAITRLAEINEQFEDASIREAFGDAMYGAQSVLSDCVGDAAYALQCWAQDGITLAQSRQAHRHAGGRE